MDILGFVLFVLVVGAFAYWKIPAVKTAIDGVISKLKTPKE